MYRHQVLFFGRLPAGLYVLHISFNKNVLAIINFLCTVIQYLLCDCLIHIIAIWYTSSALNCLFPMLVLSNHARKNYINNVAPVILQNH